MLKEYYIRTASLVPLHPQYEQQQRLPDSLRKASTSILFNKVVFIH